MQPATDRHRMPAPDKVPDDLPALLAARESERMHLARELHDELGQQLLAIRLDLLRLAQGETVGDAALTRARALALLALVDDAVSTVRRVASDLRPPSLRQPGVRGGLLPALQALARQWSAREALKVEVDARLPEDSYNLRAQAPLIAGYRIVQEALTNAARHSGASTVRVEVCAEGPRLVLRVSDDGRGLPSGLRRSHQGLGLRGMRERAEACGGRLRVDGAPGRGCTVEAVLPLTVGEPRGCAVSTVGPGTGGVN